MFAIKLEGADLYYFADPILGGQTWVPTLIEATLFTLEQAQGMILQNETIEMVSSEAGANFFA